MPAYRALRRAFPDHRFVLAAPRVLAPLAALAGGIDAVHDVRSLEDFSWSGPPPDIAVNLHGSGPQSHAALLATEPSRLIAFERAVPQPVPGPPWRPDEHEVRRWCRLLAASGIPADPADLLLPRPEAPAPVARTVVIHPGAAYRSRRWPAERYAAVAAALARRGRRVVVTGSPAERDVACRVAQAAGLPDTAVLAGRTGLADLVALTADAGLVICGDTGMGHLATACGTPSVLLFGPVSPALWGPPPAPRHVVLWHGRGDGDPWADQPDPSLLRIEVGEVLEAADRVLSSPAVAAR